MDHDPSSIDPLVEGIPLVAASVAATVRQRLAVRQPYLVDAMLAAQGMQDPRWEVRAAAVRALRTTEHLAALRLAMHDAHPLVRVAAVQAMGALGAFAEVVLAYQDTDWQVREMVVLTLRLADRDTHYPILEAARHDTSSAVRDAVVIAWDYSSAPNAGAAPSRLWWQQGSTSIGHLAQVCLAQRRFVPQAVWWGVPGSLVLLSIFLAVVLRTTPTFAPNAGGLLALAIFGCAAGSLSFMRGQGEDGAHEVILATRMPYGIILLSRAVLLMGYLTAIGMAGSLVLARASNAPLSTLLQIWVPGLLGIVALALALMAIVGSAGAVVGAVVSVLVQTCRVRIADGLAVTFTAHFWHFTPGLALVSCALLLFAGWYASRHPQLARRAT